MSATKYSCKMTRIHLGRKPPVDSHSINFPTASTKAVRPAHEDDHFLSQLVHVFHARSCLLRASFPATSLLHGGGHSVNALGSTGSSSRLNVLAATTRFSGARILLVPGNHLRKFVCLFCLLQPWLRIHCNRYCKRLYLLVDTEWCGQCSKLCPRHTACTWKTQVMDALRRSCIQLIRSLRMHPQDRLARPFRRRHLYHVLWLHLARRIRLPLPHRHRHKYLDPRCSG